VVGWSWRVAAMQSLLGEATQCHELAKRTHGEACRSGQAANVCLSFVVALRVPPETSPSPSSSPCWEPMAQNMTAGSA